MLKNNDFGIYSGGTGGGGGGLTSVATDNFTILGNGTIPDPIFATGAVYTEYVDLALYSETDYTITQPGFYIVYDTSNTYEGRLIFDVTDPLDGQRITIINYQAFLSPNPNTYSIGQIGILNSQAYFQGSTFPVTYIPSGTTYEFIFSSGTGSDYAPFNSWLCFNPQAPITQTESLFLGDYSITNSGNYNFYNNDNNNNINLPNPANFIGLQIQITNSSGNAIPYATNQPIADNQLVTQIPPYTTHTLFAYENGAFWQITNVYAEVYLEQVDLNDGNFTITQPGVYNVIDSSGLYTNYIYFNVTNPLGGERITIINNQRNSNFGRIIVTGGQDVVYQGTTSSVTNIPSGLTYEFVYADENTWNCYNPQAPFLDFFPLSGQTYDIIRSGIYRFDSNIAENPNVINLPNPEYYQGLQIQITNTSENTIEYGTNQPVNSDGVSVYLIPPYTTHTLSSITIVSGPFNWYITNVYNSNVNVIDLSVSDYNISYPGLYQVINADGGFQITISADQSIYNGQTITIINTDNIGYAPINTEGIVPSYQGTNTPITQLNSVSTYEFIAMDNPIAATSGWFSKATTSVPAKEDIRLVVGIEPINLSVAIDGGGFYIISVANDAFSNGGVIIFPNPNEYKGQRVVIYNTDQTYDAPISLNGNEPIDIDGSTISLISPLTSYEFISTASNWWILNNRAI